MGKDEPSTAPPADLWFPLTLGSSFKDHPNPSSKFCTLRYEFKPASIDKTQPGTLHKNKENRVAVEFHNNQPGKPKVTFEGSKENYKENEAVLFFNGEEFRLERLHRSFKRLRHIRLPGESNSAVAASASSSAPSIADMTSLPVAKGVAKPTNLTKPIFNSLPVEVERIDIGSSGSYKEDHEKVVEAPGPNPIGSYEMEEEEELDILEDDEDVVVAETELETIIDINNTPHQDMEDEVADVDVNEDDADVVGRNAAEALRAQVNAERESSSSSSSSGSDTSGSSSSTDTESSDGNTVDSI